jgi:hypothetical protein
LTGRIAYTCFSFLAVGGYDEESGILGSGYQDVDICKRLQQLGASNPAPADITNGVGDALPNYVVGPKDNWTLNSAAKVFNLDLKDFEEAKGNAWTNVNQHNVKLMKAKMNFFNYVRNGIHGNDIEQLLLCMKQRVGNWWKWAQSLYEPRILDEPPPCAAPAGGPAPEEPADIQFYTAGLQFVGSGPFLAVPDHLRIEAQDTGRRTGRRTREIGDLIEECMICCGLGQANDKWLSFDCRVFGDPNRAHAALNHIGINGNVLLGIATHARFPSFFAYVIKEIIVKGRGGGRLHCSFVCRKGRHRSVAISFLAARSLSEISNWAAAETHLAEHRWAAETCNFCEECRRPVAETARAKQRAIDIALQIARAAAKEVQR